MSGQKGRDMLIKVSDGAQPQAFVTVAGIRATTIALNARIIDGTSGDSPSAWRELIGGAGVKTASITGAGVFKDQESDHLLRGLFFSQAPQAFQIIIPGLGVLEGPFLVQALDYSGEFDGEALFSVTLASAGLISFTAI